MQTTIPLYGFGGGGGGTGASLTISAPAGATVTVSKDGKFKTKVAGSDGLAVFKGLSTGEWTVTITDGKQTAQKTVNVTADYATAITFFAATIHVTYPAGSSAHVEGPNFWASAPDTSGSWTCTVPAAGDYMVCADNSSTGQGTNTTVSITEDGQSESVELSYIIYIVKDGVLTEIGLSNSLTGRLATVTQNEGNVYVNNSYTEYVASVVTGEKIDLTPFTKVVASVNIVTKGTSSTQSKFNGIGLTLTQGVAYSSLADAAAGIEHEALASKTGTMTLTIDAESITGEWYVGFAIGTTGKFYIYDLYLE